MQFLVHLFGQEIEAPTMQCGQKPLDEAALKELHWGFGSSFRLCNFSVFFQGSIT